MLVFSNGSCWTGYPHIVKISTLKCLNLQQRVESFFGKQYLALECHDVLSFNMAPYSLFRSDRSIAQLTTNTTEIAYHSCLYHYLWILTHRKIYDLFFHAGAKRVGLQISESSGLAIRWVTRPVWKWGKFGTTGISRATNFKVILTANQSCNIIGWVHESQFPRKKRS